MRGEGRGGKGGACWILKVGEGEGGRGPERLQQRNGGTILVSYFQTENKGRRSACTEDSLKEIRETCDN